MKKFTAILAAVSLSIIFALTASAEELIKLVNIDKVVNKITIKAHTLRPACPPGNGPWIGLSLKSPEEQEIDLRAYTIEHEDDFEWEWELPPNKNLSDYKYTVAVWCGRVCRDRYQNQSIPNHPNVIRWQTMGTGLMYRY